jgi:F0F1-type ATP synthase membrane subunit b/b'
MRKTRILAVVIALLFIIGVVVVAQPPERNVSGRRHPNIAAAQRLTQQAWDKIVAAQKANEWDMNGHAQHAKELLDQANRELKAAAEAANRNK